MVCLIKSYLFITLSLIFRDTDLFISVFITLISIFSSIAKMLLIKSKLFRSNGGTLFLMLPGYSATRFFLPQTIVIVLAFEYRSTSDLQTLYERYEQRDSNDQLKV